MYEADKDDVVCESELWVCERDGLDFALISRETGEEVATIYSDCLQLDGMGIQEACEEMWKLVMVNNHLPAEYLTDEDLRMVDGR